ncbi:hypothetical protein PVAG01_10376 [Phlyctema vagabunda]|uniref:Uncharacterized protein n=1 Tax=Phlyctema vagabunda TaxID=108571 RepID=A0ABR4P5U2_9HELO
MQASWSTFGEQSTYKFKDASFCVLIESDQVIDDQLQCVVLGTLHRGGRNYLEANWAGGLDCGITRKTEVPDEYAIPWIWMNDTYAITLAYQNYWTYSLTESNSKNLTIATPTPQELLRFYQSYMVSVNTINSVPTLRKVSVWKDTVQLSTVLLAIMVVLHKASLDIVHIPDGKMDWMIHAAKTAQGDEEELIEGKKLKDRDHLSTATFGCTDARFGTPNTGIRRPSLARVYTTRGSNLGASPSSIRSSVSQGRQQQVLPKSTDPIEKLNEEDKLRSGHGNRREPSLKDSAKGFKVVSPPSGRDSHHHPVARN